MVRAVYESIPTKSIALPREDKPRQNPPVRDDLIQPIPFNTCNICSRSTRAVFAPVVPVPNSSKPPQRVALYDKNFCPARAHSADGNPKKERLLLLPFSSVRSRLHGRTTGGKEGLEERNTTGSPFCKNANKIQDRVRVRAEPMHQNRTPIDCRSRVSRPPQKVSLGCLPAAKKN